MQIKIKKFDENAVIPFYSREGDAGMDLTATSAHLDELGNIVYGTGIGMKIPDGHVGLIFPRSSVSKYRLSLANCVGIIDPNYLGEIILKFKPTMTTPHTKDVKVRYDVGDRVGQIIIMPFPRIEFEEVDELGSTERGEGGFGSSGK